MSILYVTYRRLCNEFWIIILLSKPSVNFKLLKNLDWTIINITHKVDNTIRRHLVLLLAGRCKPKLSS